VDTVHAEAGGHIKLETEEQAEYLQAPAILKDANEVFSIAADYMERASIPRILQGQYVGAVSGVAMNLLRNPTLMKVAFSRAPMRRLLLK
jgi:hypothetical protein